MKSVFSGRTIQVVRDLHPDEQWYLYQQTRQLKEALRNGGDVSRFRLNNPDLGMYLFFMEDSTRTKESFRNAGKFHGVKLNDFDAKNSSFQKKESITDTIKMLVGYSSSSSIFVVRSRIEGVCRWLEGSMAEYAAKIGVPQPAFINAGDGRHEHPTQEFLDEFSFLEQLEWKRDHIHIALVGDLFHGRTVHSKVDGLEVFREVQVDLIAPPELAMPEHYLETMKSKGFELRIFESIDEYLAQDKQAPIWYFTRLQLERMGEKLLNKAERLRRSVTFRRDHLDMVDESLRFYHPLPRHSETPTIPTFLDSLPLNRWDEQSMNGYLTRVIELAMVGGRLGSDYAGSTVRTPEYTDDFIQEATRESSAKPDFKVGIKPVQKGIVIDHIAKGKSPEEIWDQITKIRRTLDLNSMGSHGVFPSFKEGSYKGIISLPEHKMPGEKKMKMLSAISPGVTLNLIEEHEVIEKYRLSTPPRVYRLPGLRCKNEACVSNPDHHEPIFADFIRSGENQFTCHYCETPHLFSEVWR
jgi:aspartate carbamoyltransferase